MTDLQNLAALQLLNDLGNRIVLKVANPKLTLPSSTPHEHGTELATSLQVTVQ